MKDELKQTFTRRLTQCNKSEMVVIMYDILFAHLDDARQAHAGGDYDEFKADIRRANAVLERLMADLNFKYDLSKNLYEIYMYCRTELSKAIYEDRTQRLEASEELLQQLYQSFAEVAKHDTSGPMMANTQQVYAGMTYGKESINENLIDVSNQRGFLV